MKLIATAAILAGCSAAGTDTDGCVPGRGPIELDGELVVCGESGNWVQQSGSGTDDEPNETERSLEEDECAPYPPGTYLRRYAVASGSFLGCQPPVDQLVVIRSDGTTLSGGESEDGDNYCTDDVVNDGCKVTGERRCFVNGCDVQVLAVIDGETEVGTVSVVVDCASGYSESCVYDTWLETR